MVLLKDFTLAKVGIVKFCSRKPLPPDPALGRVAIDFLAARRAWRFEIDSNALKLELIDGPGGSAPYNSEDEAAMYVDARVRIVAPESDSSRHADGYFGTETNAPVELLLPRALLRPVATSGRGTHAMKLAPCFVHGPLDYKGPRGLDDARFLHDHRDMLLLELSVETAHENDDIGDLYVPEDLEGKLELLSLEDSDGWEEVSQLDETEDKDGGWVKANFGEKDE
ncbi:hypothetical protein EW145_g1952 [Phellinidium pouzarii]|uniref:Uncharacterized protein n=1 Tax=Phellinidium pouzarii TaxID=167371 RepID=A0A4S4LCP0_9AGAM|nr:hypothetical protein EW145_g1952 [Phellinidium pouzarii]